MYTWRCHFLLITPWNTGKQLKTKHCVPTSTPPSLLHLWSSLHDTWLMISDCNYTLANQWLSFREFVQGSFTCTEYKTFGNFQLAEAKLTETWNSAHSWPWLWWILKNAKYLFVFILIVINKERVPSEWAIQLTSQRPFHAIKLQ